MSLVGAAEAYAVAAGARRRLCPTLIEGGASTGGWGFAQFDDGKPAGEAVLNTCFTYHEPAKARDFVFTRYAP